MNWMTMPSTAHRRAARVSGRCFRPALFALVFATAALGADRGLTIDWEKNYLTIHGKEIPGGTIRVLYLEAYCKSGSTDRDWGQTTIPHATELLSAAPHVIRLKCRVQPSVVVEHEITAGKDDVTFRLTARNEGKEYVDVVWAQPCMRVDKFTGLKQDDYFRRCFIFTDKGLTALDKTHRGTKARYVPGQVYVPKEVDRNDVNPRPLSDDVPANGLIGAFSADSKKIVAMAWDQTQELFQGVIVCIHSDFRIGGLKPGETKKLFGKIYIVDNDVEKLLARYNKDFGRK